MKLAESLIDWYLKGHRDLPWRNTEDPYKIWLSEIILQQTRVDQGKHYYYKFVETYPTVSDLASAPEEQVLKLWQGLGYYSRARNLRKAAIMVEEELNGQFPADYNGLLKLKGVGPYTAAAIASFAFKEKRAAVDGNVYRVLSRIFGIKTPIDNAEGKKQFEVLANELIPEQNPDLFNQAIMEFGATLCTPRKAQCDECPFSQECYAYSKGLQERFPVKAKKNKVQKRFISYFVIESDDQILIRKRSEKGFWHQLWDFPGIEKERSFDSAAMIEYLEKIGYCASPKTNIFEEKYRTIHILSHRKLHISFFELRTSRPFKVKNPDLKWVNKNDYESYAIPRVIDKYWAQRGKPGFQRSLF